MQGPDIGQFVSDRFTAMASMATHAPHASIKRREPSRLAGLWRLAVAGIVVAGILAAANFGLAWYSRVLILADRTTQTVPVALSVEGERFRVPANLIRFSDQRSGGPLKRLDLAVLWPSMTGYSRDDAGRFDDTSKDAPTLFVTIAPLVLDSDSTGRLAAIYAPFFSGPRRREHGLTLTGMRQGIGYENEIIAFEAGATEPFVARCYPNGDETAADTCLREIHISGKLAVTYRFRIGLLGDWRKFDARIRALVAGLSEG